MTRKYEKSTVKSAAIYSPLGDRKTTEPKKPTPRFYYRLAQHMVEREPDGWWLIPENGKRQGPFATPQDICIAIARAMCAELSNRHHTLASFHGIGPGHPLYGLPDPPTFSKPRKARTVS